MTDIEQERAAFEAAYDAICNRPIAIREIAWRIWQARAQQPSAGPVAFVDERAISWLEQRRMKASAHITTKLSAVKSMERPMPLYARPAADVLADAERYRWLRDVSVPPHNFYLSVPIEFDGVRYAPADVDAYIDAARAKGGADHG